MRVRVSQFLEVFFVMSRSMDIFSDILLEREMLQLTVNAQTLSTHTYELHFVVFVCAIFLLFLDF